jgi:hypothetical protein
VAAILFGWSIVVDAKKREALETAGWKVGDAGEFLGLTEEERQIVEFRLLAQKVHTRTDVPNRQTTTEVLTMGITHSTVSPHRSVDATGRALPMTVEEIHAQAVEIARGLDALDDMGDEEEQRQTLSALMKAIDEEPLSPRRRFRQ